ncbi:MAG: TolC family protein [Mucilaginibacter sp.]|uniref:TolC family protein n=1 Tax=Mucilaginibacter sp. TaxID=1882438 RepID=UPI003267E45E
MLLLTSNLLFGQKNFSLAEAISLTLQNNLQVRHENLNALVEQESVRASILTELPHINASATLYSNYGRSLDPSTYNYINQQITTSTSNIYASFVLFEGLEKKNRIAERKLSLGLANAEIAKLKKDLTLRVIATYFTILTSQEQLKVASLHNGFDKLQLQREEKLLEVGKNIKNTLTSANAQFAKDNLTYTQIKSRMESSRLELSQLLEVPNDNYGLLPPGDKDLAEDTVYNKQDIMNRVMGNNPEIKAVSIRESIAKKEIELAKGELYPSVSLIGVLSTNYSSFPQYDADSQRYIPRDFFYQSHTNFYQYFGFNINVPIFNAFSFSSNVKRQKIKLQESVIDTKITKNNLSKTVDQAVSDINSAKEEYRAALNSLNATQEQFKMIEFRYKNGLENIIEYNRALSERNQAEIHEIEYKYNVQLREYLLKYFMAE